MVQIFNKQFSSDLNTTRSAIETCLDEITQFGKIISENDFFDIKVILNELLVNAAKHGNKWNPESVVKVKGCFCRNKYVVIIVEDEGEGFNYTCCLTENMCEQTNFLKKECGRGLLIVKNLCSRIRFNKKGNQIRIIKCLTK